jgi:hypothetical protein
MKMEKRNGLRVRKLRVRGGVIYPAPEGWIFIGDDGTKTVVPDWIIEEFLLLDPLPDFP